MTSWEDQESKLALDELTALHDEFSDIAECVSGLRWLAIINKPRGKEAWVALKRALCVSSEFNLSVNLVRAIKQQSEAVQAVYGDYVLNPLRDKPLNVKLSDDIKDPSVIHRYVRLADVMDDLALAKAVRNMTTIPNAKLSYEPLNQDALGAGFKWILDRPGEGITEGADPLTVLTFHQLPVNQPL